MPELSARSAASAGAAVLALLAASVIGLLTVGGPATGASGASVPGYPPTSRGLVLQHLDDAGFDTAVRDAHDPRLLYVVVPHDDAATACNVIHPVGKVIAQTRTVVRIEVAGYEYLPPPDKSGYSGFSCYLGRSIGLPVRLSAPLGSRSVRSGAHLLHSAGDAPATVVDPSDLPAPRHLPAGYRAVSVQPMDVRHGRVLGQRTYARGTATLVISSGPAGDVDLTGAAAAGGVRAVVNGIRATVVTDAGTRCVLWRVPTGNSRSVCSRGQSPLIPSELLAVARSLS